MAAAVEVEPESILGFGPGIATAFSNSASEVWRATEGTKEGNTLGGPTQVNRGRVERAQRIGIEEVGAVEADAGEDAVVESKFEDIDKPGFASGEEHAPIPENITDVGAGFVMGGQIRELVISAIGLVDASDALLILCAVGRCAVIKRAAAAGDVHFLLNDIGPDAFESGPKGWIAGFDEQVGCAGIKVIGADSVAHRVGLLSE